MKAHAATRSQANDSSTDNDDMRSLHNLIHLERPSILAHTSEFFGTMGSSKIEQRC